jgi:DNA polymerase elongation subunit (family B)
MGRTVLPYSQVWEAERQRWQKFRRALRQGDQVHLDRLFESARLHLQPGEKVRYIHREGKKGPKECRVQAAPFLEALDGYDTKLYLDLLERAVEEVMLPFGEEM